MPLKPCGTLKPYWGTATWSTAAPGSGRAASGILPVRRSRGLDFLQRDALDRNAVLVRVFLERLAALLEDGCRDDRADDAEHQARGAARSEVVHIGGLGDIGIDRDAGDLLAVGVADRLHRGAAGQQHRREQHPQ
jgi:hypothetical protein